MCLMRLPRSKSEAGPVTISRPLRSTVIRSALVSASSSACEMKIIATPRPAQRLHEFEEMLRLLRSQRRRGLVEDDHPGVVEDRAGDLDHLPLGRGKRAGQLRRVDVEIQPLERLARGVSDPTHGVECALAAQHHVLRHGKLRHEARFLKDHRDAEPARVLRARKRRPAARRRAAAPSVGGMTPAISLHSVDLPAPFSPTSAWISPEKSSKSAFCQRGDAAVALGHVLERNDRAARSCRGPRAAEVQDFSARLADRDDVAIPDEGVRNRMTAAIGARMRGADRHEFAVQFDDQSIGERGRPGLDLAEQPRRAELDREVMAELRD